MKSNFHILEQKLKVFIRKFYLNKALIGALALILFAGFCFLLFSLVEYFSYLEPKIKQILLAFLGFSCLFVLIFAVVLPIIRLIFKSNLKGYKEISSFISQKLGKENKILSVLELNDNQQNDFLISAINQKIDEIKVWNFDKAIDFNKTRKFIYVFFAGLFSILLLSMFNFDTINEGFYRFSNTQKKFVKKSPYNFVLLNDTLKIARGKDFTIKAKLEGKDVPREIYLNIAGEKFMMTNDSSNYFSYNLSSVNQDFDFSFDFLEYSTTLYSLDVYDLPIVDKFVVKSSSPKYTKVSDQFLENEGNLTVVRGSRIDFRFNVKHADKFKFVIDSLVKEYQIHGDYVEFSYVPREKFNYFFMVEGQENSQSVSNIYTIDVVQDKYPNIQVSQFNDSINRNAYYFSGHISDDYGFDFLKFVIKNGNKVSEEKVNFEKTILSQDFFYYYDFKNIDKNDDISYYFVVGDNDKVRGSKVSKSQTFNLRYLDKELKKKQKNSLDSLYNKKLSASKKLLKDLAKDLDNYQKSLMENPSQSKFDKQMKINSIFNKQKALEDMLKEITDINQNAENLSDEQLSKELLEQFEELQDMWNQVLDKDLKNLLDQISNLQKDLKSKNLRDSISNIKYNLDELQEKLERNNIALKQFEIDNNLDNAIEKTKELAKEYDKFSESKEKSNKDFEEFEKKLSEIQENYQKTIEENEQLGDYKNDYKDFSEAFDNLMDKIENQKQNFNEEVSREKQLDSLKNLEKNLEKDLKNLSKNDIKNDSKNDSKNDVKKEIQDIQEKLDNLLREQKQLEENVDKQNQQNNKDIKETSQEMQELAEQIEKDKQETLDEEIVENMQDIRQILDNLVTISFEQENLLTKVEKYDNQTMESINFVKEQQMIKNDFDIVRDSIFATMKRVKELDVVCYDKIKDFYSQYERVNQYLLEGYVTSSVFYQRKMLTFINDLALIFAESFAEKKQQMGGQGKPKNIKANSSDNKKQAQEKQKQKQQQQMQQLKQMSQSLKKQLEQLQKSLQDGKEPSSKQFVQSLLEQEMMIEQLKQMLREGNQTKEQKQILNELNRLFEQNRNDIVNKNVSRKTIERQNQILDKFLKAEKAENENEQDEERKSNKAGNIKQQDVEFDMNLIKKKTGQNEFLKQDFINLDLFYQEKTNEYLHNLE